MLQIHGEDVTKRQCGHFQNSEYIHVHRAVYLTYVYDCETICIMKSVFVYKKS